MNRRELFARLAASFVALPFIPSFLKPTPKTKISFLNTKATAQQLRDACKLKVSDWILLDKSILAKGRKAPLFVSIEVEYTDADGIRRGGRKHESMDGGRNSSSQTS